MPLSYFLCEYLKAHIWKQKPAKRNTLKANIERFILGIPTKEAFQAWHQSSWHTQICDALFLINEYRLFFKRQFAKVLWKEKSVLISPNQHIHLLEYSTKSRKNSRWLEAVYLSSPPINLWSDKGVQLVQFSFRYILQSTWYQVSLISTQILYTCVLSFPHKIKTLAIKVSVCNLGLIEFTKIAIWLLGSDHVNYCYHWIFLLFRF